MVKCWLAIAMALLLILQPLLAIGDADQLHHPNTPVYAIAHDHSHEAIPVGSGDLQAGDSSDRSLNHASDHCHQNHAHFHIALTSETADIAVSSIGQKLPDYRASPASAALSSLFRPPIS